MQLSVIIPVYHAEKFITHSVTTLKNYLDSTTLKYEIILVNDGSTDGTEIKLQELAKYQEVRVFKLEQNQGKFGAISKGMQESNGDCCLFTDADLPFDLKAIEYAQKLIATQVIHVVVGDRMLAQSESEVKTTLVRKFFSLSLSAIIRLLMTGGLYDTQCGLKAFRKDVAKLIFPMLKFHRFAGDIEVLYISLKYNLTLKRIPVRLLNSAESTVNPFADCFGFLKCIFSMRLNWDRGFYVSAKLSQIGNEVYWKK